MLNKGVLLKFSQIEQIRSIWTGVVSFKIYDKRDSFDNGCRTEYIKSILCCLTTLPHQIQQIIYSKHWIVDMSIKLISIYSSKHSSF